MNKQKSKKPEIIIDEAQFIDDELMEMLKGFWDKHDPAFKPHITIIKNRAWVRIK